MKVEPEDVLDRFRDAVNARDKQKLSDVLHEDFVTQIPQSGERPADLDAFWTELSNYPDGGPMVPALPEITVVGDEDRWAITPGSSRTARLGRQAEGS